MELHGFEINLEIVDTCGTDSFPAMDLMNMMKSDVVVLVYDLTR